MLLWFISYVSVDDLHVLQETIMGIFTTSFQFLGWATLSFNALGLMDNKLVCDRVVANVSVDCSMGKTKLTGYSYSCVMKGNELHGTKRFQL